MYVHSYSGLIYSCFGATRFLEFKPLAHLQLFSFTVVLGLDGLIFRRTKTLFFVDAAAGVSMLLLSSKNSTSSSIDTPAAASTKKQKNMP